MKYKIVSAATTGELEKEVQAAMADGWMPEGGLSGGAENERDAASSHIVTTKVKWAQAMVKNA